MSLVNLARPDALDVTPVAPHLVGSAVLRMVQEDGGGVMTGRQVAPQWPPPAGAALGAHNFMARCARQGGREVEWPPRGADPSIYLSNPTLRTTSNPQVPRVPHSSAVQQPPVPPRPSLYALKAHSSAPNLAEISNPSGTDPPTGDQGAPPPVPPPPAMAAQQQPNMTSSSQQPQQPGTEPNQTTIYPSNFKLRNEMPVEQEGAKVFPSQPAFKRTQPMKMRGDNKWPPASAGDAEEETQVREFIKPKKQSKDYSGFFAQHQLPASYTGYRAPPGTQHVGCDEAEDATDM